MLLLRLFTAEPSAELKAAIEEAFGGMDELKKQLKAAGATQFGSGWAWLVKGGDGKLAVTKTLNAENPVCYGQTPLLTVDVWEHVRGLLSLSLSCCGPDTDVGGPRELAVRSSGMSLLTTGGVHAQAYYLDYQVSSMLDPAPLQATLLPVVRAWRSACMVDVRVLHAWPACG